MECDVQQAGTGAPQLGAERIYPVRRSHWSGKVVGGDGELYCTVAYSTIPTLLASATPREFSMEPTHDEDELLRSINSPELRVQGISLPVHLGCFRGEKQQPQTVEFDVVIRFETPPQGMVTDRLAETVSYVAIVDRIKETVTDREFSLIEYLGKEVFAALKGIADEGHRLQLTVRKVSPPVPEITRGAEFTISE